MTMKRFSVQSPVKVSRSCVLSVLYICCLRVRYAQELVFVSVPRSMNKKVVATVFGKDDLLPRSRDEV